MNFDQIPGSGWWVLPTVAAAVIEITAIVLLIAWWT